MVGKMSKDIGMGVYKGTMVSFVPTLFGYFWGFHPYMSFVPGIYTGCSCSVCHIHVRVTFV